MESVNLQEVKGLNEEMYNIFSRHDRAISQSIAEINKWLTSDDRKIPSDCVVTGFFREHADNYKDDGNTTTPGYTWSAYWALPLSDQSKNHLFNKHSIENGYCPESIIFTLNSFDERIYDKRISGCKFVTLYFNFGEYKQIIDLEERAGKKMIRLDYTNNNYDDMYIYRAVNLSKIVKCMRQLREAVEIYNCFAE